VAVHISELLQPQVLLPHEIEAMEKEKQKSKLEKMQEQLKVHLFVCLIVGLFCVLFSCSMSLFLYGPFYIGDIDLSTLLATIFLEHLLNIYYITQNTVYVDHI